jgi:hypothetical protein
MQQFFHRAGIWVHDGAMVSTQILAWAADALLVLQALFIAWVVLGALAVSRWPRLAWLHLPAAAWGVWIEWAGGLCPLTPLEWRLRAAAGQGGQTGDFIEHYLGGLIYPAGLTREVQLVLGVFVLLVNAALYLWIWRRRARRARIA